MSSVNLNDVNACKTAYLEYYAGNTSKVSKEDIKEIETKYKSQLKGWKMEASKDTNSYEIDDETEQTPKKSKKASNKSAVNLGLGVAKAAGGVVATKLANNAAINGVLKDGCVFVDNAGQAIAKPSGSWGGADTFEAFNPTDQVANDAATKANNTSAIGFMVECTLGLATGIAYQASKANKDEHAELMELEGEMKEYLSSLEEEQTIMEEDFETIDELSENAETVQEESGEETDKLKKEYDEKVAKQSELKVKIDSGEELTESEKAEYEQLGIDIKDLGEKISTIKDEATEEIEDATEQTEEVQEDLETTSETIETIQDTADYAEGFDKGTQKACIMESVAQGLNVASSTKGAMSAFRFAASGAALFGSTLWANAFGAMGVSGATMSALGVVEQAKWAKDIGNEIDVRKEVQALNAETLEAVDANADKLDTTVETVEEVNTTVDEIEEVPEEAVETKVPVGNTDAETKTDNKDEDKDKLKEDKPV